MPRDKAAHFLCTGAALLEKWFWLSSVSARSNQCTHLLTHLISLLGLHPSNNFPPFPTGRTLYYITNSLQPSLGEKSWNNPNVSRGSFYKTHSKTVWQHAKCPTPEMLMWQCSHPDFEDIVHERHEATHIYWQTPAAWKSNECKLPWHALPVCLLEPMQPQKFTQLLLKEKVPKLSSETKATPYRY